MLNTLSFLGLVVAAAGILGAYTKFTSATLGIYLVAGGLAWTAFLFLPALLVKMKWRDRAGVGFTLFFGFLALAALGAAGFFWRQHPLNDVTTNTAKPPAFLHPVYLFQPEQGAEFLDKSFELPRAYPLEFVGEQAEHYPELETIIVKAPPVELAGLLEPAVRQIFPDGRIVYAPKDGGHVEAEVENPWLRTVDDLVVEVRESKKNPNISNVDMRLRNRFPYGDFGMGAQRLQALRAALEPELRKTEQKWAEYQEKYKAIPAGALPGTVSDLAPGFTGGNLPGSTSNHSAAVPAAPEKKNDVKH